MLENFQRQSTLAAPPPATVTYSYPTTYPDSRAQAGYHPGAPVPYPYDPTVQIGYQPTATAHEASSAPPSYAECTKAPLPSERPGGVPTQVS